MFRKCYLKCIKGSHPPISLIHKTEIIVGRSKTTKIKDQQCSRKQLSLIADCEQCVVEIKQVGMNPSGFDGFGMVKDTTYKVNHGTRVEILLNDYIHLIEFEPIPESDVKTNSKRKFEGEDLDIKKKTLKMENETSSIEENYRNVEESVKDVWECIDKGELYIFTSKGVKASEKIAAFDMDGTLIKTKSGKVHPVDTNDWELIYSIVPKKLQEYFSNGYKVVILSNQAPIGKGRVKIEDFKIKIENIYAKLKIPLQVFISTGKGFYRKPTTGMWDTLTSEKNNGIKVDMSQSFYVGDAAGRVANWAPGKKKDHSSADKLMAENLGLKFFTPEEFFLGHSVANIVFQKPEFIPMELKSEPFNAALISKDKELLVLVGYPGSGKSFIGKQIVKKSNNQYAVVCRDIMGSWQKCAAEAKRLIQQGKSVIVDSTNPDLESRARWTALAKEMKVPCRCAKLATSFAHARHNNKFRELMKEDHLPVADMIFYSYKNKFVEPATKEGFSEVIEVKFSPSFEDKEAERIYRMHLLEK